MIVITMENGKEAKIKFEKEYGEEFFIKLMDEGEIIVSIQSGNIGENIRITDEQIESLTVTEIQ